jgi:hypothetical protein
MGACAAAATDEEFFEMRVRPVLAAKCGSCHGPASMAGLRVDSREALLKGGTRGPAIQPGDSAASLLVRAVTHADPKLKMPPGGPLAASDVEALRQWIDAGAPWPQRAARPAAPSRKHWSFEPVRSVSPPPVETPEWANSAVDRFLYARMKAQGLSPLPRAAPRTLIRRVALDLTGLPPDPAEVAAFERDPSPEAFARVVDRLLSSPRYGERWGRFWLDIARYSDDKLNSTQDDPRPNAFRYRDWVIKAFNEDMPYDVFVKAQIAGDLLPDAEKYEPGVGFYAMSPEFQDDRVDATGRGFLALTVGCAQCHDHKFDPIPQKDFYSLLGVFQNTKPHETPLAPEDVVKAWDARKKEIDDLDAALKAFLKAQALSLAEVLAHRTADYLRAARSDDPDAAARAAALDAETVRRWADYLKKPPEHSYPLDDPERFAREALRVFARKKEVDEQNLIRLGGSKDREVLSQANLVSLEREEYVLWRDLYGDKGLFHYGETHIGRFLSGEWKRHLETQQARLQALRDALPPQYPFLHSLRDVEKPANIRIHLRGNPENLGEEAPRRFLQALCEGEPPLFQRGSGRLDLAEAIASPRNPLTARVIVNRVWQHLFGQGLVRTPSNFGALGEKPSHPDLLDYLASRLVALNWSLKALQRELLLTRAYASASASRDPVFARNAAIDPANVYLWRAHRERLDAEALRDSLLWASDRLELAVGGPPGKLEPEFRRRTVYSFVSRRKLEPFLGLFDFPNPNNTAEKRLATNIPLQRLYFLNSPFVLEQAQAFAARLQGPPEGRIEQAYRILFARLPEPAERQWGLDFTQRVGWREYAQVLLASNEFTFRE